MYDGFGIPDVTEDYHTLHRVPGVPDGAQLRYWIIDPPFLAPRKTVWAMWGRGAFLKKADSVYKVLTDNRFRVIATELPNRGRSYRVLGHRDHINSRDIHLLCAHEIFENVVIPHRVGPLASISHSQGGHVVSRLLAEYGGVRDSTSATVFLAPMHNFTTPPLRRLAAERLQHLALEWMINERIFGRGNDPDWRIENAKYLSLLTRAFRAAGRGQEYAFGQGDYSRETSPFDGNGITNNEAHYTAVQDYLDVHPEEAVGGVTWDWLHWTKQSIALAHRSGYIEPAGETKSLIISGSHDVLTPATGAEILAKRIEGKHVVIDGAMHDLIAEMELPEYRAAGLDPILDHLDEHLSPRIFSASRPPGQAAMQSAVVSGEKMPRLAIAG